MIDIAKLEKSDIGRWVEYRGIGGEVEHGRLKSWNDKYIFVVYKCAGEWNRFQEFTGVATEPKDLRFKKRRCVNRKIEKLIEESKKDNVKERVA